MRVRRFFAFVSGELSGRVSSEASSDVCMGEGSQILIHFGGACTEIRKGVLNQHVGIQPTVFCFSFVFIDRLPRHP